MHGTFNVIDTPFDTDFDAFIASLYRSGTVPPVMVLDELPEDERAYFKRTGCVAVLSADEDDDCPVFGNWGTYYEFEGWLAYRAMARTGNEFQLMVADVLANEQWSPTTVKWIGVIHALVTVQELYADKHGHYPANLNKFIKQYIAHGSDWVLSVDVY